MVQYEKGRSYSKKDINSASVASEVILGVTVDKDGDLCFWFTQDVGGSAENNIATDNHVTFKVDKKHIYSYLIEHALSIPCHFFWRDYPHGPFVYRGASDPASMKKIAISAGEHPIYELMYL